MAENTKKWEETGRRYRTYIKLEKRLSQNTVESYMRDLRQFAHFILRQYDVAPRKVEGTMIERYMAWLFDRGREKTSQARCLCGIRSFFNFLLVNDQIESSPAEFVDTPKFGRPLPDILTTDEIDSIIATVDMRSTKGLRDSAMLEVLYSCGLRVSELTSLRLSDLFFGEGYIRVIGKGDKQRLVPISNTARDKIQRYLEERRSARSGEDTVFLNNRGGQLTRVMVFTILKRAVERAGIDVNLSARGVRVERGGLVVADGEGEEHLVPGDTVICAIAQRSRSDVADALRDAAPFVRVVGDAVRPSNIPTAVYEAYHAALDI